MLPVRFFKLVPSSAANGLPKRAPQPLELALPFCRWRGRSRGLGWLPLADSRMSFFKSQANRPEISPLLNEGHKGIASPQAQRVRVSLTKARTPYTREQT